MLRPLPYHEQILDFLKSQQEELWNWFASQKVRKEAADAVRLDLLKSTYRMERSTHEQLYEVGGEVAEKLEIEVPPTFYQSQHSTGEINAGLAYVESEPHVVFRGPLIERLEVDELRAVIGHELSHFRLWHDWQGEYLIADQILSAMTHDLNAEPAHVASARLMHLYNEVFCDRGAVLATDSLATVVSALVKTETGLEQISVESFLKQAEEVLEKGGGVTEGVTHPESFIRARAARLWSEQDPDTDAEVTRMIEGPLELDELDLIGQLRVAEQTRRLIETLLEPAWMRTENCLNHARLFFNDFQPPEEPRGALAEVLARDDAKLSDYFCYVMLDFVTADRQLEDLPLAYAIRLSRHLELEKRFAAIAQKELRMRKKQFQKFADNAEKLLATAAATPRSQT